MAAQPHRLSKVYGQITVLEVSGCFALLSKHCCQAWQCRLPTRGIVAPRRSAAKGGSRCISSAKPKAVYILKAYSGWLLAMKLRLWYWTIAKHTKVGRISLADIFLSYEGLLQSRWTRSSRRHGRLLDRSCYIYASCGLHFIVRRSKPARILSISVSRGRPDKQLNLHGVVSPMHVFGFLQRLLTTTQHWTTFGWLRELSVRPR